ncbi:MAG TPA: GntR family transcriptional regulator [Ktedonobacterales bacterium]
MKNLITLESLSLRERVYRALRDALVAGELAPGARLRDQDLAEQLGVSRTPVREALQRLEDEGLVQTAPRSLTRVAPLDELAAREAFPVVAALHALAARSGVARLTPGDIAAMRAANEELAGAIAAHDPATVQRALAADDAFHAVLLRAAANSEITRTLERLTPKVRRLEYAQFGSLAGRKSVRQHTAIIGACERGDAAAAAALVEENWLTLGQLIASSLSGAESAAQRA